MASQELSQMRGPPYASMTAGLGGLPQPSIDIPPTAVFLVVYLVFAVTNMTILQLNLRRKHKFLISGAMFGFCVARTTTCIMRIVWATHQTNVRIAIAANVFFSAGVLLLYLINIIFAQRILRAKQPQLGWHGLLRIFFEVLYVLLGLALVAVIVSAVLMAYTLNAHTRQVCRDIQLAAITYLFVLTTIPLFLLAAAYLLPKSANEDHFGQHSINRKSLVLLTTTCLCIIISGFKTGTQWQTPRPAAHPAWFDSKACFYVFSFAMEILALTVLTASRVDRLFHVPNGSKAPGDYTALRVASSASSEQGDEFLEAEKV